MTFRRPTPEQLTAQRADRRAANLRTLCTPSRSIHRAVVGGNTSGQRIEKENALQSKAYERAAKGLGYCARCGKQVVPHTGGLDFCHADLGKGQGIKTDCRRGWQGCRECHDTVGRHLPKDTRRVVEAILADRTRRAIRAAGTWPASVPQWREEE